MRRSDGYFYGNAAAVSQGWCLVQLRSGRWDIRTVQARGIFKTNKEAVEYVRAHANEDNSPHFHDAWTLYTEQRYNPNTEEN